MSRDLRDLSVDELDDYKRRLGTWQAPNQFVALSRDLHRKLPSEQLFTSGRMAFARDAWIGSKIAAAFHPDAVRLGIDQWPDFESRTDNALHKFEFTEADIPGRRRGDEYAVANPEIVQLRHDPIETWIERAEQVPVTLGDVASKKAGRRYPPSARLVIYLNISEFGIRRREIEAAMAPSTEVARKAFEEIWVLWNERLYLVWDKRVQSSEVIPLNPENIEF